MNFRILKKECKWGKTIYHLELTDYSRDKREELLNELDRNGAPFGGAVQQLGDDRAIVEIYYA